VPRGAASALSRHPSTLRLRSALEALDGSREPRDSLISRCVESHLPKRSLTFRRSSGAIGLGFTAGRASAALGVEVAEVSAGSLADLAGVRVGELLVRIDGQHVRSVAEAKRRIDQAEGAQLELELAAAREGGGSAPAPSEYHDQALLAHLMEERRRPEELVAERLEGMAPVHAEVATLLESHSELLERVASANEAFLASFLAEGEQATHARQSFFKQLNEALAFGKELRTTAEVKPHSHNLFGPLTHPFGFRWGANTPILPMYHRRSTCHASPP
jgi:hypothetical protein